MLRVSKAFRGASRSSSVFSTVLSLRPSATQAPPISDCVGINDEWVKLAMPWAAHLKKACPTAYTFPYDDQTSTFTCFDGEGPSSENENYVNTQSCELGYLAWFRSLRFVFLWHFSFLRPSVPSSFRAGDNGTFLAVYIM